ncbi:MAG: PD-(D/E)XK nuclease family protein, partial [Verrucomicrobiota bacterium]
LCDDFKLFSHSKRRRIDPKFSQLTQLGDPSDPSSVFASLPETCTVDLLDTEQTEQKPTHVMITDASETISLPMAQSSADLFPRRILPHSLSHGSNEQATEEPEQRSNAEPEWPVPAEDNPGIRYGTWWHSFMERLPWQDGEASCRACFDLNAQDAPDAQRAEIEFALLLKSEIYEILCQSQWVIHQETPFMAQLHEDECLDGIIDLAAFHQERQEWLIIDWKTDRIQKPKDLIEKYNAQIHAYLQAMQQLTDCPAKGLLYSTRQGKSVSVI